MWVGQLGGCTGYVTAHVGEDFKISISKCVVEKQTISLRKRRRCSDNVYNWDILGVTASNGIDQAQLTNAKSRDDSRDALDSSVAVCCIASVQLIAVADPIETSLGNVIECYLCQ